MKRLVCLLLFVGACGFEDAGSVEQSELGVPSCGEVDLSGIDVSLSQLEGGDLLVTENGVPVCVGSELEVETSLDRDEDEGEPGTPLPAADGDGDKPPDELPGTPLPSVTR